MESRQSLLYESLKRRIQLDLLMIMKPVKGKNFNEFFSQKKGCGTTHPSVVERYVPVEDFQTETAQHEVFGVPTTILYFEGKEILRKSGYYSLEESLQRLKRFSN